jgi:hypothetical protein
MPEANDRAARRDADIAAHKAAVDAQAVEAEPFIDAGYEETLPGQVEIEAGTVEHVQVLNTFANATSYGPDVNVVVPPEEPPPDPPVADDTAVQEEQSGWRR